MNLPVGNKKHNIIYSYLICLKGSKEVSTQEEDREEDQASGKTSSEKKSKPSQLCVILWDSHIAYGHLLYRSVIVLMKCQTFCLVSLPLQLCER